MDNYETRLYALAVRAPISEVHTSKVENELALKIKDRLEQECSINILVWRMIKGKKCSSDYSTKLPKKIGGITIDIMFSYPPSYLRLEARANKELNDAINNASLLFKAYAALDYAKSVINTPQEQVVLCLPVEEEVCKAILEMPTLEKNISEYLNTPFDKDSVLASVKEFLESIEQYEYKEPLHKESSKPNAEYTITWNETTPSTSINWWIWGGVMVNIILLILILCI